MPVPPDWSQNFTAFVNEWKRKSNNQEYIGDKYLGDNPFGHFVVAEQAGSWDDFLRWSDELNGPWCFRGQREAKWTFETSLDRGVKRESFSPHHYSLHRLNRKTAMQSLLYQFQQYAHTYLPHVPPASDLSSWYSLMQHYCAPTPLLDWTESPYVAMYFAVENKASGNYSAVWAVDSLWMVQNGRETLENSIQFRETGIHLSSNTSPTEVADYTNTLLRDIEAPILIKINPAMSNPRLFAQRGLFLCKLVEQASVAQLLMTMMMYPKLTVGPVIRKLEVASDLRIEFLKRLRAMNIHRASLFPGLDGLGQSLRLDLEAKDDDF